MDFMDIPSIYGAMIFSACKPIRCLVILVMLFFSGHSVRQPSLFLNLHSYRTRTVLVYSFAPKPLKNFFKFFF